METYTFNISIFYVSIVPVTNVVYVKDNILSEPAYNITVHIVQTKHFLNIEVLVTSQKKNVFLSIHNKINSHEGRR